MFDFQALCNLMDRTPFRLHPYRGILTRVGTDLGYPGRRRSVFQAIKVHRTTTVMLAVARAIREAEKPLPLDH